MKHQTIPAFNKKHLTALIVSGNLTGIAYGVVIPFYVLGMALYYLATGIKLLVQGLAWVAGGRALGGRSQAPASRPGTRTFMTGMQGKVTTQ